MTPPFIWWRPPATVDVRVFRRAPRPRVFERAPRVRGHGAFVRTFARTFVSPNALGLLAMSPPAAAPPPAASPATPEVLEPGAGGPVQRFVASDEERVRVEEVLRAAKSASTRRAYKGDWARFTAWCEKRGAQCLPAAAEVVVVYLRELLEQKKSTATIERALVTISTAQIAAGFARPQDSALVSEFMRGLRRLTRGRRKRKATPISLDELRAMVDATSSSTSAGLRDRAMLLVGFFGAFRRSELVALDQGDLIEREEGLVVRVGWSKTDQEGEGDVVGIPRQVDKRYCPVDAVRAWREMRCSERGAESGALFIALDRRCFGARMKPQAVERVLEAAARRAKLAGRFTPHSMRAGFATAAARAGAPERSIMKQTRHRSVVTLYGYIREANVFVGNSALLT